MTARSVSKICVVDGCESRLIQGHGLCHVHYMRLRRTGSVQLPVRPPTVLEQPSLFWDRVRVTDSDQCWTWQDSLDYNGYGVLWMPEYKKTYRAHRVAFYLHYGHWANPVTRHTCDNPPCCNPAHLLAGTVAENNQDKVDRNRQAKGRALNVAKLTEDQVREIRKRGVLYATGSGKGSPNSQRALAAEFGVSRPIIRLILKNELWRHVT